uniref:RNA helicase n=1 Tax=Erpetoichthys calabaricus TaxID=27687 RepID=A0A8C4S3W2_ERPCA
MSYGYGNRRGRGGGRGGFNDGNRWDRGGSSNTSDSWDEQASSGGGGGGGGRGRGRHPAHLKGKEIGLWYAKRGGAKRKEEERKSVSSNVLIHSDSPEVKNCTQQDDKQDLEYLFQDIIQNSTLDQEFKNDLQKKKSDYKYLDMKVRLLHSFHLNCIVVISGETGCGKTTQVTQFILDDYIERNMGSLCRIVCTQPRRISAISVAERVAAERAESCGDGNSCGYQIRLQCRLPRKQGSILYCTTGIILQWLQSDPHLSSISHIVLDEIHERNLQSDVLITIVKDLLKFRDDLKIILMSATLNASKFSKYFGNSPMLHIPGFTFPVKEYFLEDVIEILRYYPENNDTRPRWKKRFMQGQMSRPDKEQKEQEYRESWPSYVRNLRDRYSESTIEALEVMDNDDKIDLALIVALIKHIVLKEEDGAILVFLPGWDNISGLHELLMAQTMFKSDHCLNMLFLYHELLIKMHLLSVVFKKKKTQKTLCFFSFSITIEDIVHVIDGGKIKETHFDTQNNISTMTAEWVSLANAKQRKGRAGRVKPGKCYHLYNKLRATLLDDYQLPEIMRTPLEELCLQIKILKLGRIALFLWKTMDPPSEETINLAITHLMALNALDKNEELTPLGFHLARLPVEPHIGKMILFGALLGCLDPVLIIAASLSFKDPFYNNCFHLQGKEKLADTKRRELSKNSKSDHLTVVNAFWGWEEAKSCSYKAERDYCWENFLSSNTLQMLHNMKGQFAEHLLAAGFVSSKNPKDHRSNINSDNEKLIKAVICAGLYPKVAKIQPGFSKRSKMVKVYTKPDGKVSIHPKSVNAEEREFNYSWLIYHLKMKTSSIFLYDCTEVTPYSLLFFGGDISIQKDKDQDTIAVDEWIVFQSPARIAHLVKDLRKELDALLQEKIKNPKPVDWYDTKSKDCAVISAIIDLITTQETSASKNCTPRFAGDYYD